MIMVWVTCRRDESWSTSQYRHRVRRGGITTACGATASMPEVWTPNYRKPKCPQCAKVA